MLAAHHTLQMVIPSMMLPCLPISNLANQEQYELRVINPAL